MLVRIRDLWKRFLFWIGATALCVGLCGCAQATAEDAPRLLTQKENEHMLQTATDAVVDARTLREQLSVPDSVRLDLTGEDGYLRIAVDAAVTVPDVSAAPVLAVTQDQFSQQTVRRFWDALCRDTIMYSDAEEDMSKPELAEAIERAERYLDDPSMRQDEMYVKQTRGLLRRMKQWYPTAPATEREKTVVDGTLGMHQTLIDYDTGEVYNTSEGVRARNGDICFSAWNDGTLDHPVMITYNARGEINGATLPSLGARLSYHNGARMPKGFTNFHYAPLIHIADESAVPVEAAGMLHTTPADARRAAEALLAGTPMAVSSIELVACGKCDEDGVELERSYLYGVYCSRVIMGVPCAVMNVSSPYSWVFANEHTYEQKWDYESCVVLCGDDGIASFSWCAPMRIANVLTQRAALLPFSEIMELFSSMAPVVLDDMLGYRYGKTMLEAKVHRIALCLQRITDQSNLEEGMLVPVWNFYGDIIYHWNSGELGFEGGEQSPQIVLSINAINGNIMQPDKGH